MSRSLRLLAAASLSLALGAQAAAEPARPTVGLVLGGGGARGAAHIGVLEVLEELRVPVDCIAGTSMGALVAGAYAAGLSPATMRAKVAEADWDDMFIDYPDYDKVSFRYKQVLRRSIPGSETGVSADGIMYPPSIIGGQKIKLFFNELVGAGRSERLIEKLPLPLSIIATDIGTGERVVLREGRLTVAMRASMSVPGLLAPVRLGKHHLVDGGLVDNVPIEEVRQRCNPDLVIAVNVGSPLMKADDVNSLLSVSAQMVNILTEQNVTRSLATLKPADIYIKPDLGTITAGDFSRNAEAADRGRAAAEAVRDRLARLSTSPAWYAEWRTPIDATARGAARVDDIQIVGLDRVNPAMVSKELQFSDGDEVHQKEVTRDALKIFGQGTFESVDYEMLKQRDRNILRLLPVEKSWGPDYLRFALLLETETSSEATWGMRLAYQKTLMNELGGELLAAVDIGNAPAAGVNFYQPLDPEQKFFVSAGLDYSSNTAAVFQDNEKLAQYKVDRGSAGLWLGTNIGSLGQATLGAIEQYVRFERDVGATYWPEGNTHYFGWRANLTLDQFNRLYFPTKGWGTRLEYFNSPDAGFSRAFVAQSVAGSVGNTVGLMTFRYTGSVTGKLPVYDAAKLGGIDNMVAFARGQIAGDDIYYLGARLEHIIGKLPLGISSDLRIGINLEGAHVGEFYTETNLKNDRFLNSTSVYLGGATPIGPLYLGFGYSTNGSSNLFFSLGVPFNRP